MRCFCVRLRRVRRRASIWHKLDGLFVKRGSRQTDSLKGKVSALRWHSEAAPDGSLAWAKAEKKVIPSFKPIEASNQDFFVGANHP